MGRNARAAFNACVMTLLGALVFFIPGIDVIALIIVMLPLWVVSDFAMVPLGRETNGFFVPNATGWLVVAAVFWLLCFSVAKLIDRGTRGKEE